MNDQAKIAGRIAAAVLNREHATPLENVNLGWLAEKCNELAAAILKGAEK